MKLAYFTLRLVTGQRANVPNQAIKGNRMRWRGRTEHHHGGSDKHLSIPSFIQPSRIIEKMPSPAPLPPSQTRTPIHLAGHPQKSALVAEFAGKHLQELRTPALVIDRHVFSKNCAKMHANAAGYGAAFRAHLKTHKVIDRSEPVIQYDQRASYMPPVFLHHSLARPWKGQGSNSFPPSLPLMRLSYLR